MVFGNKDLLTKFSAEQDINFQINDTSIHSMHEQNSGSNAKLNYVHSKHKTGVINNIFVLIFSNKVW